MMSEGLNTQEEGKWSEYQGGKLYVLYNCPECHIIVEESDRRDRLIGMCRASVNEDKVFDIIGKL